MDKKNYIQDSNGVVYKVMDNHYLKLSPWEQGEDRRVTEIKDDAYTVLTYKNACMIVNAQFAGIVEEWDHNGKHYIADALPAEMSSSAHSYLISTLPSHNKVIKPIEEMLDIVGDDNAVSVSSNDGVQELKMVRHKGKIYYILLVKEFLPRVQAYNLFGEFCQWVGINDCKPIFNETDNKFM